MILKTHTIIKQIWKSLLATRSQYLLTLKIVPQYFDLQFFCYVSEASNWQMASLWSLVQDSEYVFSRLYAQTDVFPSLFGTCGGLFVVEALEPIKYPAYYDKLTFKEWAQRVSVALAMLDFLDELDNVLDEPVYLCDVKREHFGISDFGRVKFLDLDSVFLKNYLGRH